MSRGVDPAAPIKGHAKYGEESRLVSDRAASEPSSSDWFGLSSALGREALPRSPTKGASHE